MRQRYKLLIIIFMSFLFVIFSYFFFRKDKFIYVNLGSELSFNNFSTYNYTDYIMSNFKDNNFEVYNYPDEYTFSKDIYYQITKNAGDISYYLKNADLITISLGSSELNNYKNLNEEVIIEYLNNIYILLTKLKKLNNNLYLINVYDKKYELINRKIKEYCELYEITYIDEKVIGKDNMYVSNLKTYLSYTGHKNIFEYIVKPQK